MILYGVVFFISLAALIEFNRFETNRQMKRHASTAKQLRRVVNKLSRYGYLSIASKN